MVSNISDSGYLGIHGTVALMVPLLQQPQDNPHATLVTLFMNAVDENQTDQDRLADISALSPTTKRLVKYFPPKKGTTLTISDPEVIKFSCARDVVGCNL